MKEAGLLMLSISCEDNRYVTISLVHKHTTGDARTDSDKIEALVDTGAAFSCFMADSFQNLRLREEALKDANTRYVGGYITRADEGDMGSFLSVKFYEYQVDTFTIGRINLHQQTIWITFDRRIELNLLGMDMLCQVGLLQYPNSKKLVLFETKKELDQYTMMAKEF